MKQEVQCSLTIDARLDYFFACYQKTTPVQGMIKTTEPHVIILNIITRTDTVTMERILPMIPTRVGKAPKTIQILPR